MPESIEARLAAATLPQRFAAEVAAMVANGASLSDAAKALGIARDTARAALECAAGGATPNGLAPPGRKPFEPAGRPPYVRIAEEVARRRDEGRQTFRAIASELGVSPATVTRAYDWAHRADLAAAIAEGRQPGRGRLPQHDEATHREIARLLQAGRTPDQTAREVGCGRSTVYRVRTAMRS
jgi:DNA invertase Pin-like site-specific DNA recombinase